MLPPFEPQDELKFRPPVRTHILRSGGEFVVMYVGC
jgi:hypothetical protein